MSFQLGNGLTGSLNHTMLFYLIKELNAQMQWLCDFVLPSLPQPNLNLVELKLNLILAGGLREGREGNLTMVDRRARGGRK
jgi:hypothetical protein